jgi:hypothetical protein
MAVAPIAPEIMDQEGTRSGRDSNHLAPSGVNYGTLLLILLCHKFALRVVRWQQGHRGSVRAMAWAMATRTEVIEFAT